MMPSCFDRTRKMNEVHNPMVCAEPERTNPMRTVIPWRNSAYLLALGLLFIACYHQTLEWMYNRYVDPDSYYSQGFLIPFVSAYLVWGKRHELRKENAKVCPLGLLLVVAALLTHIAATVFYVFSLSGFSILMLLLGISVFLLGIALTRIILFPLAFLIFMFPVPTYLIEQISFPMKMLVAKTGVAMVELLGIPVYRSGLYITIPAGQLLVANPCSGLWSLIAFLALGTLLAHMTQLSLWRKGLLILLTIPVALVSNMARVPMLILISHFWGLQAAAPHTAIHTATGVFMFILGLFLLLGTAELLGWRR